MAIKKVKKKAPVKLKRDTSGDIDWSKVVLRAKEIVESYDTGVTLRQLYYRLVSEGAIPNAQSKYKRLSDKTAQARRAGWFPALIDRTREIEHYAWWDNGYECIDQMVDGFRLDRTEGQKNSIYLGVEKHGMSVQLMHWFGKFGIPVLALGGYSSQTFVDEVKRHVENQGRPSVLLYAGDFDPSGVDIDRDFEERTEIFDHVYRVALNKKQIVEFDLPPMPGKAADSRSASFILAHGELIQVELDAIPPDELRKLYQKHIDKFWDKKAYEKALEQESEQREVLDYLRKLIDTTGTMDRAQAAEYIVTNSLQRPSQLLRVADAVYDKLAR